ncbi:MAG: 50S ribosomal protein L21 [Armatimonadota bacterium]|nr:50S ribosomal protein L21 [Armatimonadota bacterium]
MYAIVEAKGKQYRVEEGMVLCVDKLPEEPGQEVLLDQVLLIAEGDRITVGKPVVEGARVVARVLGHGRHKKIRGLKYKPKVRYRRRFGHRQPYTEIRIERIEFASGGETSNQSG